MTAQPDHKRAHERALWLLKNAESGRTDDDNFARCYLDLEAKIKALKTNPGARIRSKQDRPPMVLKDD